MESIQIKRRFQADTKILWAILSDQEQLPLLSPDINMIVPLTQEKPHFVQRVEHKNGASWQETCIAWEENKAYTMEIEAKGYPLAIAEMRRTIELQPQRQRQLIAVILRYDYLPKYGPLGKFINNVQIRPILTMFSHQWLNNVERELYKRAAHSEISAASILQIKPKIHCTLLQNAPVSEAIKQMTTHDIRCLLVISPANKIIGVLSEKDIIAKLHTLGADIIDTPVSSLMTTNIITCDPQDGIMTVMGKMSKHNISHLPVVDAEDNFLDIISISDVVKSRIDELEKETNAMQQYMESLRWREVSLEIGRSGAAQAADG